MEQELKDLYGEEPEEIREGQKYGIFRLPWVSRPNPDKWKSYKYTGDFFDSPFFKRIWPYLKFFLYVIGVLFILSLFLLMLGFGPVFFYFMLILIVMAGNGFYWASRNPNL